MTIEEAIKGLKALADAVNAWHPFNAAKVNTIVSTIEAELNVKDWHITNLSAERDKYNTIAANLQSSRGKVLMYLEDLETRISDFKMWLQDKVDDGAENYDKDEAFKEALEQLNKTLGGEDARNLDN